MWRWQTWVGVVIGVATGCAILTLARGSRGRPILPSGAILSECDGHFRDLVIHYEPSAAGLAMPVYQDFLRVIEHDVTVHVVCPSQGAFVDFSLALGPVRCQLRPVVVGHDMTTWSRDRWVALEPGTRGGPITVWSPRGEAAEEIWPARAGDERIGQDLAAALGPSVRARRSSLYFDGGDFLADGDNVFVMPRVLQRNIQHTVGNREEFLRILSVEFKRRVILLDEAPDHHAGMFMVSAGRRRMLVGDPSLAKAAVFPGQGDTGGMASSVLTNLPNGPDFSSETQRLFDSVAAQCVRAGYTVTRLPVIPARDGRTFLTYANVLIDQQGCRRIVYLPFYSGAERLNREARGIWEQLGYEVRAVNCTSAYRHFGCLHCLVNVLRRFP